MERKLRKTAILALAVAFFVLMAAMCVSFVFAGATGTVSSTGVFSTSGGATAVSGKDVLTYSLGDADGEDAVSYRRNLALKWFAAEEEGEGAFAGKAQYFELTLGFAGTGFTSFTMTMETTQLSMSKAGKTVNEIVFTPAESGGLDAAVNGTEKAAFIPQANIGSFTVSLGEKAGEEGSGSFTVSFTAGDTSLNTAGTEALFTNIGKNFAKYASSSSSTPVTPLAFTADTEAPVEFTLQSMNGQSFALNDDGQITDDTPPVLVIDSEVKQFVLGSKFDFEMTSVDVCSSAVTSTEYYRANPEAAPSFDENGAVVTDDVYTEWKSDKYFFDSDFEKDGATPKNMTVSVAVKLSDGNANSSSTLLEWYGDYAGTFGIPVVRPEETQARPVTAFFDVSDSDTVTVQEDTAATAAYQEAVSAAVLDEDGEPIPVGSGAYYYIPSLKSYIGDETCGYTDMEFTVYYRTKRDTSSNTYDYDELRIELTGEGTYSFRVVPTNAAGRAMTGYIEKNDGSFEAVEITSENVWDVANLKTFTFSVVYNGPVIEQPETEPDIGYVDVSYTFDDFTVTALSGYRHQDTLYALTLKAEHAAMTLSEVRAADAEGRIAASAEAAEADANAVGYWRAVAAYDEELGEDEGDNVYEWNPSSRSFVPQSIGFYKLRRQVSDGGYMAENSQIVSIASDADVVPGIPQWLENNLLSVIFLAVGAACLIAIVVLLLIKPKKKAPAADAAAGTDGADGAAEGSAEGVGETLKEKRAKRK